MLLSLVSLLLPVADSADVPLPPIQHHVYYSGSHVTSIAVRTPDAYPDKSGVYVNDVVHSRIIHYNSSGNVQAVWNVTDPPLYSPTSLAHIDDDYNFDTKRVFVADSTSAQLLTANIESGKRDDTVMYVVPRDMWEVGIVALGGTSPNWLYGVDRYRGYTACFEIDGGTVTQRRWLSDHTPPQPDGQLTAAYVAAATVVTEWDGEFYHPTVYLADGTTNRILRINETGDYDTPLVIALPEHAQSIQALSWTLCDTTAYGCLWMVALSNKSGDSTRMVLFVQIDNGTVLQNWTISAGQAGGRAAHGAVGAVTAAAATARAAHQHPQQWADAIPSHLVSPAITVLSGYPSQLYMADADPDGPGHVVVVRDETGAVVQQFDSIPPQLDLTGRLMHAFSAVQVDNRSCTLWLTDVDNGGLLVQAAADGTLLQHFDAPALFTAMVSDYTSDPSSPSLVLLSSNATGWQLWRFFTANGTFIPLDTTSANQQLNSSISRGHSEARRGSAAGMGDDAIVGGLSIDYETGTVIVSFPSAGAVLLLNTTTGEWSGLFNTTQFPMRPTLVAHVSWSASVIVVATLPDEDNCCFLMFDPSIGYETAKGIFPPPMSQPMAIILDISSASLYVSDTNGLVFQMDPNTFKVGDYDVYQPMPAAYTVGSLSMDTSLTLYGTDSSTRRLVMLFLGTDRGRFRPSSKACNQPSSSSSSSSSSTASSAPSAITASSLSSSLSSSSSSTGSSGPLPHSRGGLLSGLGPLVVAVVSAAAALVLAGSVYCWVRRRRSSRRRSEMDQDEDEQAAYEELEHATASIPLPARSRARDEAALSEIDSETSSDDVSDGDSDGPLNEIDPTDSRYNVYVQLYEALLQAEGDMPLPHGSAASLRKPRRSDRSDDGMYTRSILSTSTEPLTSSSTSSNLSTSSSSRRSVSFVQHSSGDSSGSGSVVSSGDSSGNDPQSSAGGGSAAAITSLSAIARLSSSVVPRYIDEVTDLTIIGEGVSGRVYCGLYGGVRVVVKLPKSRSMSGAQWREWQAHLRLPVHPALVSFVGSLVMEDTNYLVCKWVEQGSLKSLLAEPTRGCTAHWYSRPYGVMRAVADVAAALHHMHRHGLLHRDVSARNVLVSRTGTFVLADLGMCVPMDGASSATTPVSSSRRSSVVTPLTPQCVPLRWCSPEVLSSWHSTDRADVWALGVTAWECTTSGKLPYNNLTDNTTLQARLESGQARLEVEQAWRDTYDHTDEQQLTHSVEHILLRCMDRDVTSRPDALAVQRAVQQQLAEWEAECPEQAERVKRRWEEDHEQLGRQLDEAERRRAAQSAQSAQSEAASTHT